MTRRHQDGSAKGDCHTAQVLLPRTEHAVQSAYAKRLGLPFSTFARASMRLARDPEVRQRLVEIAAQIASEQRGGAEPVFPALSVGDLHV